MLTDGYIKVSLVSLHCTWRAVLICPISTITSIRQPQVGTVYWTLWIANIAIFYGNGSDITYFENGRSAHLYCLVRGECAVDQL